MLRNRVGKAEKKEHQKVNSKTKQQPHSKNKTKRKRKIKTQENQTGEKRKEKEGEKKKKDRKMPQNKARLNWTRPRKGASQNCEECPVSTALAR